MFQKYKSTTIVFNLNLVKIDDEFATIQTLNDVLPVSHEADNASMYIKATSFSPLVFDFVL